MAQDFVARLRLIVTSGGISTTERRMNKLERSTRNLRRTLFALTGTFSGVVAAAAGIQGAIRVVAGFEQSMANVRAISGSTEEQLASLTDEARRLGQETRFSATEAAEGMAFLARTGFEVNEIITGTGQVLNLAQGQMLDFGRAADIATNVTQSFGLEVSDLNRVIDVLSATASSANTDVEQLEQALSFVGPVAAALGVTVEEASATIGLLGDAGIQATRAGTGLRKILSDLISPTAEAQEALQRLGLTMNDIALESEGDLSRVIQNFADAGATIRDIVDIVGVRAAPAFEILIKNARDGGKSIDELAESLRQADLDEFAQGISDIQTDTLAGDFDILKSVLSELALALGEAGVLSALRSVTQAATDFVRYMTDNLPTIINLFQGMTAAALAFGAAQATAFAGAAVRRFVASLREIQRLEATLLAMEGASVALTRTGRGFGVAASGIDRVAGSSNLASLALAGMNRQFARFGAMVAANPVGAVIVGVVAATGAFIAFRDQIARAVFGLGDFSEIMGIIKPLLDDVFEVFGGFDIVIERLNQALNSFGETLRQIGRELQIQFTQGLRDVIAVARALVQVLQGDLVDAVDILSENFADWDQEWFSSLRRAAEATERFRAAIVGIFDSFFTWINAQLDRLTGRVEGFIESIGNISFRFGDMEGVLGDFFPKDQAEDINIPGIPEGAQELIQDQLRDMRDLALQVGITNREFMAWFNTLEDMEIGEVGAEISRYAEMLSALGLTVDDITEALGELSETTDAPPPPSPATIRGFSELDSVLTRVERRLRSMREDLARNQLEFDLEIARIEGNEAMVELYEDQLFILRQIADLEGLVGRERAEQIAKERLARTQDAEEVLNRQETQEFWEETLSDGFLAFLDGSEDDMISFVKKTFGPMVDQLKDALSGADGGRGGIGGLIDSITGEKNAGLGDLLNSGANLFSDAIVGSADTLAEAVGASVGGAIGQSLGDPIGKAIGSAIGKAVGGLFTGKPSDKRGQIFYDPVSGLVVGTQTKDQSSDSLANLGAAQNLGEVLGDAIKQITDLTEGSIESVNRLNIAVGSRDGIQVGLIGPNQPRNRVGGYDIEDSLRLRRFENTDEGAQEAARYALSLALEGLSGGVEALTALAKAMNQAQVPIENILDTLGKVSAALALGNTEELSEYVRRLNEINEAFDEAFAAIEGFGGATNTVVSGLGETADQMRQFLRDRFGDDYVTPWTEMYDATVAANGAVTQLTSAEQALTEAREKALQALRDEFLGGVIQDTLEATGSLLAGLRDIAEGNADLISDELALLGSTGEATQELRRANFENFLQGLIDSGNSITDISDNFQSMIDIVEEAGGSVDQFIAAFEDVKATFAEAFDADIQDRIENLLTDPVSQLEKLLKVQEQRMNDAIVAGGDLAQVERLAALELRAFFQELNEEGLAEIQDFLGLFESATDTIAENLDLSRQDLESIADTFRDFAKSFRELNDELTDEFISATPAEGLGIRRDRILELLAGTQAGDQSDAERLAGEVRTFVDEARRIFGNTAGFQEALAFAQDILSSAEEASLNVEDTARQQIAAMDLNNDLLSEIKAILEEQRSLAAFAASFSSGGIASAEELLEIIQSATGTNLATTDTGSDIFNSIIGTSAIVDAVNAANDNILQMNNLQQVNIETLEEGFTSNATWLDTINQTLERIETLERKQLDELRDANAA